MESLLNMKRQKDVQTFSKVKSAGKCGKNDTCFLSDASRKVIVLLHGSRRLLGLSLVGWSLAQVTWSCPQKKVYPRNGKKEWVKVRKQPRPCKDLQSISRIPAKSQNWSLGIIRDFWSFVTTSSVARDDG